MALEIDAGQYSIAGVKPQNEDACGIRTPEEPLLTTKGIAVVIADGVSGSDAGREASEACVHGFLSDFYSTPDSWTAKTSAQKILSALNRWLYGQGQREYGSSKGMVTTLSALVFKSNTAHIFHVGDTRIYRLRDGQLEPLTQDHRLQVSAEKSYLTRAMGIELMLDIDYRSEALEKNDCFVLLTDGVYEFVNLSQLNELLVPCPDNLQAAAEAIVQHAVDAGSDDNLTCQIVRIRQLPAENEAEFYRKLTELPFPPPLEADQILDGYRILRHLFSTKRTEVYLAKDPDTQHQVVLKAPSVNYTDDADFINQFLHEEWAGRRIRDPHVVKVLEQTRTRQCLYYVTEHIEGQTLRQWMRDNPRPPLSVVRDYISQIAQGLRAFHRLEMIHQDLKPENILIDNHGTLKIIDFGSTKIAGIEEIASPLDSNNLLGTVNYTAPEYHIGDPGSNRSDIFSLGVIAYELLSGELPYGKDLSARNLNRIEYRSIKQHAPEVPVWVDRALEKAVRINAERRYNLLSEFVHDLYHPNPEFIRTEFVPLIERNPVAVWQLVSLLLLISNLVLLYFLTR